MNNQNGQSNNIGNSSRRIFTVRENYQNNDSSNFKPIPFTVEEEKTIQQRLSKALGPEYVSYRPQGGTQVLYIEGWKAINLANEIFGFNGWNSQIISCNVDFIDSHHSTGRFSVGISMIVRVSLKDGTFHEDVGYGYMENCRTRALAFEKCRKEAMTDGLKRCLRCFGNLLGNCLYDKKIEKQLKKLEESANQVEYEESDFHRDPLLVERERKMKHQEYERKIQAQEQKIQQAKENAKQHAEKENLKKQQQNTFVTPKSPVKIINLPQNNPQQSDEEDGKSDDDSFLFSDDINEDIFEKNQPQQLQTQTVTSDFGFVGAKNADLLQNNQVNDLKQFDTSFVATSIKRTVDPTKSVPIKRTDLDKPTTNILKSNHLYNKMNQPSTNPLNYNANKILNYSQKRPILEQESNNDFKRPCNE